MTVAGGGDRWEPKGRGRGGLEPPRRPQEGFPDRWVTPADPVRPRGDKWGPAEGMPLANLLRTCQLLYLGHELL